MRREFCVRKVALPVLALAAWLAAAQNAAPPHLPLVPGSVRVAVIGDSGTGGKGQFEVAAQMVQVGARNSRSTRC